MSSSLPPSELRKAQHRAAVEAIAQAQLEELNALTDEEALRRTLSLELFTLDPLPSRPESGLVQMQALLQRARHR